VHCQEFPTPFSYGHSAIKAGALLGAGACNLSSNCLC